MNDTVPVLAHADYLARLGRIRSGVDPIANRLDRLTESYDSLVDAGMQDTLALQTMRGLLLEAIDGGISPRAVYDALHADGMRLSFARFSTALQAETEAGADAVQSAEGQSSGRKVKAGAAVAAPAVPEAPANDRRNKAGSGTSRALPKVARTQATSPSGQDLVRLMFGEIERLRADGYSFPQICAVLNYCGATLPLRAFRTHYAAVRADFAKSGARPPSTPWKRILDNLAPALIGMFQVGCSAHDVIANLNRHGLAVPAAALKQWMAGVDAPLLDRTRLVGDFEDHFHALGGQTVTVTVDRLGGQPFRATVLCSTPEDAAFAQSWLGAGLRAIDGQVSAA